MKQFLKYVLATVTGIILVTVIMGILGAISLVGLAASSASSVKVDDNSVFTLSLNGIVEERAEDNPLAMLTNEMIEPMGLDDILSAIKKAKNNDNIKGIYIEDGLFSAGSPANMHAIREALLDFKKSGKWIAAYSEAYTEPSYYICSVADHVWLNPSGVVDWHGLGGETYYLRDLLAKVGVRFQAVKVGKYKSAVEMLTSDHMSDYDREQTEAYVNGIWNKMLADVSKSRHISVDSLNAYADRFITFNDAKDYVKMKLVDKLMYTDEVKDEIKNLLKIDKEDKINQLSLSDMKGVKGEKENGNEVAVYYAYGEIVDKEISGMTDRDHKIVGKDVCKDLEKLMDDDNVKAVVLRVNSPGGSAYASEQMWNAVTKLKAKKPVVVSMGGYAASGGYYMSCNANYIFAEPTTITGSIGIFGLFPDASQLLTEKLGVKFDGVKTNKFSDFGSLSRPFNADELALLDAYIGRGYELFRKRVADGRHQSIDQIEQVAQGRVWLGTDALKVKLVDALGSLDDAVAKAAKMAKLDEYHTKAYPATPSWIEALLNEANPTSYLDEQMREVMGEYYEPFMYIKSVNQMNPIQARLPYFVRIK